MSEVDTIGYLIFKKVKIQDANTISSPITYGFPAVTGFLGAFHAISRKLQSQFAEVSLGGVLLACHDCQPNVYRSSPYSNYRFNQSRISLKKDGSTRPIIEEGKCDLTMTFVVEVKATGDLNKAEQKDLQEQVIKLIYQHRIAGGSVVNLDRFQPIQFIDSSEVEKISALLIPAFVLMDAEQDFAEIIEKLQTQNSALDALDALIEVATINHIPETQANGSTKWTTQSIKKDYGWLVPMPIGYQGISNIFAAGEMQNVRNPEYPSQYVEAIYGLGKWVFPHRLKDKLEQAFWYYSYDEENHLYRITQTSPYAN